MRIRGGARCLLAMLVGPLVLGGTLAGLGPAAAANAASCGPGGTSQPPSPGMKGNRFSAVTVLPDCTAWAVGNQVGDSGTRTLTEHWDGTSWKTVPSPNPGDLRDFLTGVRALSPGNVWAVGAATSSATGTNTLILHWDGTAWNPVSSPSPGSTAQFAAVKALTPRDIWAVGTFSTGDGLQTLIEHWNGSSWHALPSPSPARPGLDSVLTGVTATSRNNAWAVGNFAANGDDQSPLILHWNGHRWKQVNAPLVGASDQLSAVAATSPRNAWAVGFADVGTVEQSLILHWNGASWTPSPTPDPAAGTAQDLAGVTATSGHNALAVGSVSDGTTSKTLALQWTGTSWQRLATANVGTSDSLLAVAARSAGNAWMVGTYTALTAPSQTLAFHCC